MVDVIAKYNHLAELAGYEVGVQPFLFHQQPDVLPIGHLVLQPEVVHQVPAPRLEVKLVSQQVVASQDGLDDLRCALVLVDTASRCQSEQRHLGLDHHLVGAEVLRLAGLAKTGDASCETSRLAAIRWLDDKGGRLGEVVGAIQFQWVGKLDGQLVGLAQALHGPE